MRTRERKTGENFCPKDKMYGLQNPARDGGVEAVNHTIALC